MNTKIERHIDDFVSDFLPIWYCSCCVIAFYYLQDNNLIGEHGITTSLYYSLLGFYISLLPVLLIQLFRGKAKKIAFGILWGLGLLNVAVDVIVVETTGALFSIDHVFLILGSNLSESAEFFESYCNLGIVLKVIAFEASCVLVWFVSRKISKGLFAKLAASAVVLLAVTVGIFTNVLKTKSWSNVYLGKAILFYYYSPSEDLRLYRQVPELEMAEAVRAPEKIYVIIGESFSKSHSSLYGYDKLTNPLLGSLPEDRLFVYKNVEAAGTHTVPAITQMLTTYDGTVQSEKEFHDYLTVFDIAKTLGYRTSWISNQSKVGMLDNVLTRLAELADYQVWSGVDCAGIYKKELDEDLLPLIDHYVDSCCIDNSRELCFIHLMGNHPLYAARYPEKYVTFSPEDYTDAKKNQKQVLSEYDNSVVYNDYIVRTIVDKVADQDCIVVYTADHAQDLFQSSPDFYGHAIDSNPDSVHWGIQVPMMIYVSDSYAAGNPDFISTAGSGLMNDYNLKDLVYSIADIMGVVTVNGQPVREKSVFK